MNTIFGRVGLNTSAVTICSLIDHCCLPILLYAAECVPWNVSLLQSFENAYSQVFFKIFKVSDKDSLKYCQFYMSCLPIELRIMEKKLKFLSVINNSKNLNCLNMALVSEDTEFESILLKYNIPKNLAVKSHGYFGITLKEGLMRSMISVHDMMGICVTRILIRFNSHIS